MVLKLNVDVDDGEADILRARARKAELPLASYALAAALNPYKYVCVEDLPQHVWGPVRTELPQPLARSGPLCDSAVSPKPTQKDQSSSEQVNS